MKHNHDIILKTATDLLAAYRRGALGGTAHEVHPGLDPSSRENYLYFTLAPAINFQRNSEAMWRAANATYEDASTRFVFMPESVSVGREAYFEALTKYSLASFPKKHTEIWFTIARTLCTQYDSDPRSFVRSLDGDVPRIKAALSADKAAFPYLAGPKLSNYWLYMLTCFTDVQLANRHDISVIPDTHVIKASVRLGLVPEGAPAAVVSDSWVRLLSQSGIACSDMHAPLWRWSRMGFPNVNGLGT